MKFRVTMKDPDTLHDAIDEAVEKSLDGSGLDEEEAQAVLELRVEKVRELASKWFENDECLAVEIDTEAKTCTVVERGK